MGLLAPTQTEIWKRFWEDHGAVFKAADKLQRERVEVPIGGKTATLDTYVEMAGLFVLKFTRL
jgi:hypothetical protein